MLALGIGFTVAILSVADASLLRPLPFEDAERLVVDAYLHMKENQSVPDEPLRKALDRVIILYTSWNRLDEAAKFRAMIQPDNAVAEPSP